MIAPPTRSDLPATRPSTANFDVELYWQLPEPAEWLQSVVHAAERSRVVVARIHGPFAPPLNNDIQSWRSRLPGHWEQPLLVRCGRLTQLKTSVQHAIESAGDPAEQAAASSNAHRSSSAEGSSIIPIVVPCDDDRVAAEVIAPYAARLLASHEDERLRLLIVEHDYAMTNARQSPCWPQGSCVLDFDGRLPATQLQAYVQMRALRLHPSELGALREALAVEFGGFDVLFTQHLLDQHDDTLVGLPGTLPRVAQSYWVAQDVWDAEGAYDISAYAEGSSMTVHTLRVLALTRSGADHLAKLAEHDLSMRLWRACTRALMPVLETIRQHALEVLEARIERMRKPTGFERPRGDGKFFPTRELHELECSDIVIFSRQHGEHFLDCSPLEREALLGCKRAKDVRDCLAHFASPGRQLVQQVLASARRLSDVRGPTSPYGALVLAPVAPDR